MKNSSNGEEKDVELAAEKLSATYSFDIVHDKFKWIKEMKKEGLTPEQSERAYEIAVNKYIENKKLSAQSTPKHGLIDKIANSILEFISAYFIIIIIIISIVYISKNPGQSDCVVPRDSPDCLEGSGGGHPLWP